MRAPIVDVHPRALGSLVLGALAIGNLALAGCVGDRSWPRPPRVAATAVETAQPGDEVRIRVLGDDALGGTFVVDGEGAIALPACALRVAGLDEGAVAAAVARCFVESQSLQTAPPVHVEITPGVPITLVVGAAHVRRAAPFTLGTTVVTALMTGLSLA